MKKYAQALLLSVAALVLFGGFATAQTTNPTILAKTQKPSRYYSTVPKAGSPTKFQLAPSQGTIKEVPAAIGSYPLDQSQPLSVNGNWVAGLVNGCPSSGASFAYSISAQTSAALPSGFCPWDVTAAGVMVGATDNLYNTEATKFEDGTLTQLGFLYGDVNSIANGINASGEIVGSSGTPGPLQFHIVPFQYSDGTMSPLPGFSETTPPNQASAFAVNASGTVAGQAYFFSNAGGGLVCSFVSLSGSDPNYFGCVELQKVVGDAFYVGASSVNDGGTVVGTKYYTTIQGQYVFHAYVLQNGVIKDIGLSNPSGANYSSWAEHIDNTGRVVGEMYIDTDQGVAQVAFLYDPNNPQLGLQNLNQFVPPSSGWTSLYTATSIQNGHVVGMGLPPDPYCQGNICWGEGFLLTLP
jgi:uncharacterized membrane protein